MVSIAHALAIFLLPQSPALAFILLSTKKDPFAKVIKAWANAQSESVTALRATLPPCPARVQDRYLRAKGTIICFYPQRITLSGEKRGILCVWSGSCGLERGSGPFQPPSSQPHQTFQNSSLTPALAHHPSPAHQPGALPSH